MHYYLYQITNLVNGKIYVGVHKTRDMNDGYMGSGKTILRAIKKYGTNSFRKDILETFQDELSMYAREKEVVTEEFLSRKDVYNLRRGGSGGFDHINKQPEIKQWNSSGGRKGGHLGGKIASAYVRDNKLGFHAEDWQGSEKQRKARLKARNTFQEKYGVASLPELWINDEAIQKKRKEAFKRINHQQGIANSQFGTIWITDGKNNRKLKRNQPIPFGWKQGRIINSK